MSILYLRMRKKIYVKPQQKLTLADVCEVEGDFDKSLLAQYIGETNIGNGNFSIVDVLQVINRIHGLDPSLDIRNVGPSQAIVEIKMSSSLPKLVTVSLVWLLLFIGSGLAIINFHTDVSMHEVQQRIYFLITGKNNPNPLMLQIPYSLGIGLGMILFFNHVFKRRFNEEPSPMELEMFLYQETIDQYVINDERQKTSRKG